MKNTLKVGCSLMPGEKTHLWVVAFEDDLDVWWGGGKIMGCVFVMGVATQRSVCVAAGWVG